MSTPEDQYRLYQADYGREGNLYDEDDNGAQLSQYNLIDFGFEEALPKTQINPDIHKDNWNERFQAANELTASSETKNLELNQVCADFVSTAQTYAECIIREHFIPSQMRVLSTVNVGGLAGGVKFKLRGILLKLCEDKSVGGGYIYGGKVRLRACRKSRWS